METLLLSGEPPGERHHTGGGEDQRPAVDEDVRGVSDELGPRLCVLGDLAADDDVGEGGRSDADGRPAPAPRALRDVTQLRAPSVPHLHSTPAAPTKKRADHEMALQAAEKTGAQLDRLVASGQIGGYDSPARFLPSLASQNARRASLPTDEDLRQRLDAALQDSPLAANKLTPFLNEIASARQAPNLLRENLNGTSLALAVDSLLLPHGKGWSVLLPLRPGEKEIDAGEVRRALAGSDALFIDMKLEFDKLYNDYLHEAMLLSLAGLLAIVALLAVSLRSARRLAAVLLPLVLAVLIVIASLHLLGERLHLLHLVGMLLIVAVGSNYALFFDRGEGGQALDPETLASMLVANLTTAIGFGTLALSQVPVLHAVGVTVGPGAILALLFSAIFVSRESRP